MVTWNPNANEFFLEAVEGQPRESRNAYLDEGCGDDAALCEQVESLLAASDRAGSFLESPLSNDALTTNHSRLTERPGTFFGPNKLLQQIGAGGMATYRCLVIVFLCQVIAQGKEAAPLVVELGSKFEATDTLACGAESNGDAKECLEKLCWLPAKFTVHLEAADPGCGDWLVRFPSARPIGNSTNDLVSMEWYRARDKDGAIQKAPAIVVVHESGRRMTVGRLIAQGLNTQGLHAFLLHLPGYGARRVDVPSNADRAIPALEQAIADVRRARDAVAALPTIDPSVVGVQGTSLGGFVTATVAGLDQGYDRTFILLAGGNLHEVILHGAKDAAKLRKKLAAAGVTDEQIIELTHRVEPLRLAHRINPASTWLYSGKYDEVVPPDCSRALAKAARLSSDHHIELPVGHYSGILHLPLVVQEIAQHMTRPLDPHNPANGPVADR